MESPVLFNVKNGVATITLNRPDRYNAVNQELVDGISSALIKCETEESIRSVVITGAGRGFCSGADMSVFGNEVTPEQRSQYIIDQYQPLINQFFSLKKPIIGAINGICCGGGLEIALSCDIILAATHATFALPEIRSFASSPRRDSNSLKKELRVMKSMLPMRCSLLEPRPRSRQFENSTAGRSVTVAAAR